MRRPVCGRQPLLCQLGQARGKVPVGSPEPGALCTCLSARPQCKLRWRKLDPALPSSRTFLCSAQSIDNAFAQGPSVPASGPSYQTPTTAPTMAMAPSPSTPAPLASPSLASLAAVTPSMSTMSTPTPAPSMAPTPSQSSPSLAPSMAMTPGRATPATAPSKAVSPSLPSGAHPTTVSPSPPPPPPMTGEAITATYRVSR